MVDRHNAKRVVPMRVMVFGLMRTGTSCQFRRPPTKNESSIFPDRDGAAISIALNRMGFGEIYHMTSVIRNPDDAQWWLRAGNAKFHNKGQFTREDYDQLLGHCQAR